MEVITLEIGIPKSEFKDRVSKIKKLMEKSGLDIIFVYSDEYRIGNVFYIANFKPIDMVPEAPVAVYLPLDGDATLFTGDLNLSAAKELTWINDVRSIWELDSHLATLFKKNTEKIGVVGENILPVKLYRKMTKIIPESKLQNASHLLTKLRQIKSENEIALLRKAAEIGDDIMLATVKEINEGKSEIQLAAISEYNARLNNAEIGSAFIASSGPNTSNPVMRPTDRKIRRGDLIMMDLNPSYRGYCNDQARTVAVGRYTKEQEKILSLVENVFEEVVNSIKPGVKADELYKIAHQMIKDAGYGRHFVPYIDHGAIGHSIGLDVTEQPYLSHDSDFLLESNMVLAIKIGLYGFDSCGVRFESVVRVTKSKAELLNRCNIDNIVTNP